MKKLIEFSVQHPLSVIMISLAIILCSLICVFSINTDFLPAIRARHIIICTKYSGIKPAEIENMVTIPAEEAFSSLKGVKIIEAVSRDSVSVITIELKWGTDIDLALIQCREIADSLYPSLPFGCEKSEVFEADTHKSAIKIAVIPKDGNLSEARRICQNEIKSVLQKISGVSSIKITGGQKERIEVTVDKDSLDARNLTLQEISTSIACSNFEYPAGTISEGEKDFSIKTDGLYKTLEEISRTPIKFAPLQNNQGGILELGAISKIGRGLEKQDSFFLFDGKECVQIAVQKRNDANPIKISEEVKNELNNLRESFGSYLDFQIMEDCSESLISWSLLSAAADTFSSR